VNIQVTSPGHAARGPDRYYHSVKLTPNGSRLRWAFRFTQFEEGGERELVLMEAGLEQLFDDPSKVDWEREEPAALTGPAVRDFLGSWDRYANVARDILEAHLGGGIERAPRTRRELTNEFLADVVRRHADYRRQGVAPTEALAREEGVGTSTVRNWLGKARKRGIEAG
jgi:hypothetical protein